MEDIITLVNYGVIEEPGEPKSRVLEYLKDSFRELIDHKNGREIILSHLSGVDRTNVDGIIQNISDFANR